MEGKKGHRHLVLRGFDRREKQAELKAARDELYDIRHEASQTVAETPKTPSRP